MTDFIVNTHRYVHQAYARPPGNFPTPEAPAAGRRLSGLASRGARSPPPGDPDADKRTRYSEFASLALRRAVGAKAMYK